MIERIDGSLYYRYHRTDHYLRARVWKDEKLITENRLFFEEPKHLQLPKPRIYAKLRQVQDRGLVLRLRANRFVKGLRLETDREEVFFQDNYLDIDPDSPRDVQITSTRSIRELRQAIRLRWL